MNDTTPAPPRTWQVFVQGRENAPREPFATVAEAADAQEALDRVKTELNGSPAEYDRDALAPALVAVPAGTAATPIPGAAGAAGRKRP